MGASASLKKCKRVEASFCVMILRARNVEVSQAPSSKQRTDPARASALSSTAC